MRETGETVHVVEYDHDHGQDISVYDCTESAHASIVTMMKNAMDDWNNEEDLLRIKKFIDDGDVTAAMDIWPGFTGANEFFRLNEMSVFTAKTAVDAMGEAVND